MGNYQVLSKKGQDVEKYLGDLTCLAILGDLSGQILHELNNPLQVVLGFAQDLQENFSKDSEYYRDLSLIIEETRKCCQIIRSVESIQKGNDENENGDQNIALILEKILPLLQYRLRKKKLQVKTKISESMQIVEATHAEVYTAILAVLLAAIENSSENSELTVKLTAGEGTVNLEVRYHPAPAVEKFPLCSNEFLQFLQLSGNYQFVSSSEKYVVRFPRVPSSTTSLF